MNPVKEFLDMEVAMLRHLNRTPVGKFYSMGHFVRDCGREWKPQPLPKSIKPMKLKECYRNAALLAMGAGGFTYCEGFAAGVIPVLHAWVVDKDGNVIDPTWTGTDSLKITGDVYFGVAIKLDYLRSTLEKNKQYGIIDQWENQWPILRDDPKLWRHPIMDL